MVDCYYDYNKIRGNYKTIPKQHENNIYMGQINNKAEIQIQLETD